MEESRNNIKTEVKEINITISDYLKQCLAEWKWILLSLIVICGLGMMYILLKQPEYSRTMEVLIKDEENKSPMSELSSAFSSFGFGIGNSNVYNEMITLRSPAVMYEVVKKLNLDMNYLEKGVFHGTTLYGSNLPFNIEMDDIGAEGGAGLTVECLHDGKLLLRDFYKYEDSKKIRYDNQITVSADGKALRTPIGRLAVIPNPTYVPNKNKKEAGKVIKVSRNGYMDAVEIYSKKLDISLTDTDADVIELTIKDTSVERAVDILNTTMEVYNQNWIDDKNRIGVATSEFISERLKIIEQELGSVDGDISKYKSQNLVPDLKEAAKLNMEQNARLTNQILDINNSMSMAGYVKDYIMNPANANNVIPVNTGMGNIQLEQQIASYNSLLLTRNNLAASSSDSNPIVLDYDTQLRGQREAIVRGISSYITGLQNAMKNIQGAKSTTEGNLQSGPTQAKYLLSVERQQKVMESLYLFLLQKREENELNQTFTAYNTRIITPPMGSTRPVSPKKALIMIIAGFLGLSIPLIWIYYSLVTDTKVRGRRDLERMSTPFVGEIPLVRRSQRKGLRTGKAGKVSRNNGKVLENVILAVKPGSRDIVSEAFRIVRGNIDLLVKNQHTNVIMLTSFNPGSGKSFIAFNLAASFAIKGKKVLIIDTDLRHGSASQFVGMPSKGLSNYLNGDNQSWKQYVCEVEGHEGMYVLPIGHRPPNPSELIDNGKIETIINQARTEYDYVFMDCPPVDVVADTQILEKYVDRTLFVVRAGLLDRRAIIEIDEIYKHRRFKNMSIILNGTDMTHSRSYTYGGGYANAYGYYGE